MKYNWTDPYYGIRHLGEFGVEKYWVTVTEFGTKGYAILTKWFPKCGFSPDHEDFDTVQQAKRAGEKYLKNHGVKNILI